MLFDILKIAIPAIATILVAWITSRAAGRAAAQKEQHDLGARVKVLEEEEPAELRKVRDAAAALAADLSVVRRAFEERCRTDDDRRARAGEFAREREKDQGEVIAALRIEIARLQERLNERTSALATRMEDQRGSRR